jgi:hypothetical protein
MCLEEKLFLVIQETNANAGNVLTTIRFDLTRTDSIRNPDEIAAFRFEEKW